MNELCKKITPYKCPECGQEMLFFSDNRGKLIDYKSLMNDAAMLPDVKKKLYSKDIRFLKCIVCNKYYVMDWEHGFPTALSKKNILSKF